MKILRSFFFLAILALPSVSFAATLANSSITQDTVWDIAGSPYLITSSFGIAQDITLTVGSGVVIKVAPQYLGVPKIFGRLVVNGSQGEEVVITDAKDPQGGDTISELGQMMEFDRWKMDFATGSSLVLNNAKINNLQQFQVYGANVNVSSTTFRQSVFPFDLLSGTVALFSNIDAAAIAYQFANIADGSMLVIASSTISGVANVVSVANNSSFTISSSTLTTTGNSTVLSVLGQSNALVSNTSIVASGKGIVLDRSGVQIEHANIYAQQVSIVASQNSFIKATSTMFSNSSAQSAFQVSAGYDVACYGCTIGSMALDQGVFSLSSTTFSNGLITQSRGSFDHVIHRYGNGTFIVGSDISAKNFRSLTIPLTLQMTSAQITQSEFYNSPLALTIRNSVEGTTQHVVKVENSTFEGNGMAINVDPAPGYVDREIVDGRNNWWGNSSGPQAPGNANGTGGLISSQVLYDPWLTTRPDVELTIASCTERCASNVLFLPGIEASRLYRPDYAGGEDQLWEPNSNADVRDLFLNEQGKSIRDDIYTRDVLDEVNLLPIGKINIYKSFIRDLEQWKIQDKIIREYSIIPYDWRLSMDDVLNNGNLDEAGNLYYSGTNGATTSPHLISELKRLASTSPTGKVSIIAHSNGGLVAKALLQRLGSEAEKLVDNLVLVAVPQAGTPQAIGALVHGYQTGLPKDWIPLFLDPQTARTFASTSPMAYQLLPSRHYFHSNGLDTISPVVLFDPGTRTQLFIDRYGRVIGNYYEMHDFLLGTEGRTIPDISSLKNPAIVKPSFLRYAEDLHYSIDDGHSSTSSIKIYQIAGVGSETLSGIRYWTGKTCVRASPRGVCQNYIDSLEYSPVEVMDGDGTVISSSALALSTSTKNVQRVWVDLDEYDSIFSTERKHADILEISSLREIIKEKIINQVQQKTFEYLYSNQPIHNGVKRLLFILHSPLNISVVDPTGGVITSSTTTIANGSYKDYGEVKRISLPVSTTTLFLDSYGSGSFSLEIFETLDDKVIASSTISGVPVSTSTKAVVKVENGELNAARMSIDFNGDGEFDYEEPFVLGAISSPQLEKPKLLLRPDNKYIVLGQELPAFTYTVTGFDDGDTSKDSVIGTSTCKVNNMANMTVGVHKIMCDVSEMTSDKYDIFTISGELSVQYAWRGFLGEFHEETEHNEKEAIQKIKQGKVVMLQFRLYDKIGKAVIANEPPLLKFPVKLEESLNLDFAKKECEAKLLIQPSGVQINYDHSSKKYKHKLLTNGLQPRSLYCGGVQLDDGTNHVFIFKLK